jgi:hypothetical protein
MPAGQGQIKAESTTHDHEQPPQHPMAISGEVERAGVTGADAFQSACDALVP